jgi:hypothetical protein
VSQPTTRILWEQRTRSINGDEFTGCDLTKDQTDSPRVYRSQMIDQGAGLFDEAAQAGRVLEGSDADDEFVARLAGSSVQRGAQV